MNERIIELTEINPKDFFGAQNSNIEQLKKWAEDKNITFSTNEELISMPEVQHLFKEEITHMNKSFNEHEKVMRFRVVKDEWSPESGDLSATLKLKRKIVFRQLIAA